MSAIDLLNLDLLATVALRVVGESGDPVGFDAREWVLGWIQEPLPALGGARPIDCMSTDGDVARLERFIARMQSGAFC